MRYGSLEYAYAQPIADNLAAHPSFRTWMLTRTKFADVASDAQILSEEMMAARRAQTWWRSHWRASCSCSGCSGQETDLLALFEARGHRFALHIEVKQPTDHFPKNKDQAGNYRIRADCWIGNPPKSVPAHSAADTMLICSASRIAEYRPHIEKFGSIVTFEDICSGFPEISLPQ